MTQEQLKEEFLQYAFNNLNNKIILEAIQELLDNIIDEICYDYIPESNKLTTCNLIIKDLLKNES